MAYTILVVDDDLAFRVATVAMLEDHGYDVAIASNGEEAKRTVAERRFDLVISDLVMPGMNGLELLPLLIAAMPGVPVIMVTGFASISTAVEAMQRGARDYITKPCDNNELLIKIERALGEREKDQELKVLRAEVQSTYSLGNMVSNSPIMKQVFQQIQQVADTDVTVLIRGESGTGKELVARALHFGGSRRANPFVAMNCSAIPESLMESELFGYEKGAFTGAMRQRLGKFEEAHTGTLFLDEIGDTSPVVQSKLLRVLQEKTIERVGGEGTVAVETRIVAATNRNLDVMMLEGDFREDLYYRINVFPLTLPPLRERLEDLPLLVEQFIARYGTLGGGKVTGVAATVLRDMIGYQWRGNIRELENLIKRAIIKTTGETIMSIELPGSHTQEKLTPPEEDMPVGPSVPYKEYISSILRRSEETYLRKMLEQHRGNINHIARQMGIDRKTIYRKLAEHHIDPSQFRGERQ